MEWWKKGNVRQAWRDQIEVIKIKWRIPREKDWIW